MLIWEKKSSVEKGNALYLARDHAEATNHLTSLKSDNTSGGEHEAWSPEPAGPLQDPLSPAGALICEGQQASACWTVCTLPHSNSPLSSHLEPSFTFSFKCENVLR